MKDTGAQTLRNISSLSLEMSSDFEIPYSMLLMTRATTQIHLQIFLTVALVYHQFRVTVIIFNSTG